MHVILGVWPQRQLNLGRFGKQIPSQSSAGDLPRHQTLVEALLLLRASARRLELLQRRRRLTQRLDYPRHGARVGGAIARDPRQPLDVFTRGQRRRHYGLRVRLVLQQLLRCGPLDVGRDDRFVPDHAAQAEQQPVRQLVLLADLVVTVAHVPAL